MGRYPPPPQRPLRRKPGEADPDGESRKGRCLIREEKKVPEQKPVLAPEPEKPAARNTKSTDYQLLNGIRVNKGFFWLSALVMFLIVLATISVPMYYVISNRINQPEETADDRTAAAARETKSEDPGFDAAPLRDSFQEIKSAALKRIDDPATMVEEIMAYNAQATGYELARTFSLEGRVKTATREYEMNLFIKAPNQVRQVLTMDEMKVTSIYNGVAGELMANDFAKDRSMDRAMTRAQSVSLLMSAMPSMPLWQFNVDPSFIEYAGQRSHDGVMCHVLRNTALPPYVIEHFLDTETFVEHYRTLDGLDENDQRFTVEVSLKDYQQDGEFMVPTLIEVREKSAIEVTSSFQVEKTRFNQGLLPSLFSLDNS